MKRQLTKLSAKEFDLIIIGGGIYGAWAAWDAALRGLSVALIEKGDFGSGTSSNSMKIIHGGLRYLQHLDFRRMRQSIRERRVLLRIAPHLVHPLPCLMPTYGHGLKGREVMAFALLLNDLISYDRNRLRDAQKHIPRGRTMNGADLLQLIPDLPADGLTGGAMWYDAQVYNSERLLLALLHGAAQKGANMANYAKVIDFMRKEYRIAGVKIRDMQSGQTFLIRGKMVLNTAGPWVNKILGLVADKTTWQPVPLARGINLVIRRQLVPTYGVGIPSTRRYRDAGAVIDKGTRLLFLTPWRQYSILGTVYLPHHGDEDACRATNEDIRALLEDFNHAWPARAISYDEIGVVHCGLLPARPADASNGDVVAEKHYRLIDHGKRDGVQGLISVVGVKYTTARDVACKAIDRVLEALGRKPVPSRTARTPIPGGEIDSFSAYLEQERIKRPWQLSRPVIEQLIRNFGTRYIEILRYFEENRAWQNRLSDTELTLAAEVIHAVREEMACTLVDVIRRRTELGSAVCPPVAVLRACAELMATELGWDMEKVDAEVAAAQACYAPLTVAKQIDSPAVLS